MPAPTVILAVFGPEFHTYPTPPLAVIDVVLPLQTEFAPAMDAVGAVNELIICVAEAVQPLALVTVTV